MRPVRIPRLLLLLAAAFAMGTAAAQGTVPAVDDFFRAAALDEARAAPARARIARNWDDGYAAMLVDLLGQLRRTSLVDPRAWIRQQRLAQFLEEVTGRQFDLDVDRWREWVWNLEYDPHPDYGAFKARLYGRLDPRFAAFFRPPLESVIRLDEIQWGGVPVNGIPPLEYPEHIDAGDADYLDDGNIVFGLTVNGEARAYPKRVLAWHELARDRIGGREVTVVYCTLCGTVIPYESRVGGELRRFGTSGLLYQSNKLMFDFGTKSLWSSITGKPVVGPLVGSGQQLSALPVVTTTWGEWRRRHPRTTVLSLDTGYRRDYSEGAAYRAYFATDELMFDVSNVDHRLPNKAEILALRTGRDSGGGVHPIAISAQFLRRHRVYHVDIVQPRLVVITSETGANRVYESDSYRFDRIDSSGAVIDSEGGVWRVEESGLHAAFDADLTLRRVPTFRAFWFGWYAQYPDTVLIN